MEKTNSGGNSVHALRASFKKSPHWAAFTKFFGCLCDPFDWATTDSRLKSDKNPKGIRRQSLDQIHCQLAEVVFVAKSNKDLKSGQKKFRPKQYARPLRAVRFLEHALRHDTLYVCSNPTATVKGGGKPYLFVFDVDDKEGKAKDVADVGAFIGELLGVNLFWEPSTGGRGLHGWAVVKWEGDSDSYREFGLLVKERLAVLLEAEGYKATVDVQGLPPITKGVGYGRTYEKAGLLIKAPRFDSLDTFEDFFTTTPFLNKSSFNVILGKEETPSDNASSYDNSLGRFSDLETSEDEQGGWDSLLTKTNSNKKANKAEALVQSPNPWVSSYGSVLVSLQRYGTESSWERAIAIYEELGAATGERTEERIERFQRLHKRFAASYDARKGKAQADWFSLPELRTMALTLEPLLAAKDYKRVSLEDLSVIALLFKKNIAKNNGEVPFKAFKKFFEKNGRSLSNEKLGRYRDVLVDLGIIAVVRSHSHSYVNRSESVCTSYRWIGCSSEVQAQDEKEGKAEGTPSSAPSESASYYGNSLGRFSERGERLGLPQGQEGVGNVVPERSREVGLVD